MTKFKAKQWQVEDAMRIVTNHKTLHQSNIQVPCNDNNIEINEATLKQCLIFMAHMIDKHGDVYLPIFIRLKNELEKQKEKDEIKRYARDIARQGFAQ